MNKKNENNRRDTQISRMSYIKYCIDTSDNDKSDYKKLYDLIKDLTFDKNGMFLSDDELYDTVQDIMIENDGVIPNFPNEKTIENLDDKLKAFQTLYPDKFEKYRNEVEKNLNIKPNKKSNSIFVSDEESEDTNKDKNLSVRFKTIEELNPGFLKVLGISIKDDKSKEKTTSTDKQDDPQNNKTNPPKSKETKTKNESLYKYLYRKILLE